MKFFASFTNKRKAHFTLQDQAFFARRLALLVKANIPILDALRLLRAQSRNKANERMFDRIISDTSNGQYLSKSMGKYKKVFGDFAINIIKIGETSGTLYQNLNYLAEELDKKREMRRKLLGALLYPLVIMIAAFGVSGMLTIYLFPKLLPVFKSLKVDLPFTTRALILISDFLINYGIFVVIGLIVASVGVVFLLKIKKIRFFFDKISIHLPIMGSFVQDYHLSNVCRTFGLLLQGSVKVIEAAHVTASTTSNLLYEKEFTNLMRVIAHGGTISSHLEKHPELFPPLVTQMVAISEKTGNLSDTLIYLSEIYEKDFEDRNKQLSSVLEPVLMLGMGLLVGFIAISIITPIYAVTQHINP